MKIPLNLFFFIPLFILGFLVFFIIFKHFLKKNYNYFKCENQLKIPSKFNKDLRKNSFFDINTTLREDEGLQSTILQKENNTNNIINQNYNNNSINENVISFVEIPDPSEITNKTKESQMLLFFLQKNQNFYSMIKEKVSESVLTKLSMKGLPKDLTCEDIDELLRKCQFLLDYIENQETIETLTEIQTSLGLIKTLLKKIVDLEEDPFHRNDVYQGKYSIFINNELY